MDKKRLEYVYGDNYYKFNAIRKKYDPDGMFSNSYIDMMFD